MFRFFFWWVLILSIRSENGLKKDVFPKSALTTTDFIQRHGYPSQTHVVITRDGYKLELHRIPYCKKQGRNYKGVVFLMHGVESSSADWIAAAPEKSLGFVLADVGFDVWMGNARGNKYSRKHLHLDPDFDKDFWDFSWHEIGVIDLPTMIDYVLQVTCEKQLMYVGHSQGTTSFFVMTSELPQYNQKIKIMHALAPVVFMKHITNVFVKSVLPILDMVALSLELLTTGEFLSSNELLSAVSSVNCRDKTITNEVCRNIYFLIFGYDPSNLNKKILGDILQNFPAGCSTKQIIHYGQLAKSYKFQKFDYGARKNVCKYMNVNPPEYDLKKVTAKVALYVGPKDDLGTVKDVDKLAQILPNVVCHYVVPFKEFLHVDFLYATNIWDLLYKKMFEVLDIEV